MGRFYKPVLKSAYKAHDVLGVWPSGVSTDRSWQIGYNTQRPSRTNQPQTDQISAMDAS